MQIKVDLSEASQLGFHFKFGKSVMFKFLDEPREKAVFLAGFELQPLDLKAHCATTATKVLSVESQELKILSVLLH